MIWHVSQYAGHVTRSVTSVILYSLTCAVRIQQPGWVFSLNTPTFRPEGDDTLQVVSAKYPNKHIDCQALAFEVLDLWLATT